MSRRNELQEIWGNQPKPWIQRYLKGLAPRRRKGIEKELRWADSIFTEARASGNPLWVWMAYRHFRDHNLPLPEWTLAYFDAAATRLQANVQPPPEDPSSAIAEALFMKWRGRGSVFSTFRKIDEFIAAMEMMQVRLKGESIHVGVARAAQTLGTDKRTARRHRRTILRHARERHAG
jgi:hypothetical protein